MINLLPLKEKENLFVEEQRKIILILSLVVMIFFASLILILISVNFTVTSQLKSQNLALENKENEFEAAGIQSVKTEINQANQKLSELDYFYKQKIRMTGFLGEISDLLPVGIYLKNISINPLGSGGDSFQVALSGHATSIDNVIELRDKLKDKFGQPLFSSEIWFKKQDFDFDVAFSANIRNENQR